jgi:hypothetical protein
VGNLNNILLAVGGGPFQIRYDNKEAISLALDISRSFHQYYGADTVILEGLDVEAAAWSKGIGYTITIGMKNCLGPAPCISDPWFPIQLSDQGRIRIRDADSYWVQPGGRHGELGAIFLRPSAQGMEIVIWAKSYKMLQQTARLIPMQTGTGQPEFILVREDAAWKGLDGTYLGFFDPWWNVTKSSVLI